MSSADDTKNQFAAALRELMFDKPFEKVSVSDIAAQAGLSRKSFYNHFRDKYDLINWICYTRFVEIRKDALSGGGWGAFRAFLEFFASDRLFFANALQDMGQNSLGQYFSDLLYEVVFEALHDGFIRQGIGETWAGLSVAVLVEDARLAIIIWLEQSDQPDIEEFLNFLRKASDTFASMICFERVMRTDGKLCEHAIDTLTDGWTYEPNKDTFELPKPDDDLTSRRRQFERQLAKHRRDNVILR